MVESDEEDLRSRTDARLARKSEEERLAGLAKTLVGLSPKQRGRLELDGDLADALEEADRMPNGRSLARQLRVVRRQLREGDVDDVERAVHRLLNPQPLTTPPPASVSPADPIETWVQQMAEEGSVEGFMAAYPDADRQRLRTLLRNLTKASGKAAPRTKRALAVAVRQALEDAT